MSAQHTPGPYEAADPGDYTDFDGGSIVILFDGDSIVILGDDKRIAVVQGNDSEAIANANLFVAAPDLLAACIWLQPYAEAQVRNHPEATDTPEWRALLAAIAKARGT